MSDTKATDVAALNLKKFSLAEKFAMIQEHWRPKVVAALNGQEVKLVKFQGVFPWHHRRRENSVWCLAAWSIARWPNQRRKS